MTSAQLELATRPADRRGGKHDDRSAVPTSRRRRTGMVSEAVVARYIRDLSGHGRRVHGAAVRPQVATR